MAGGGSAVRVRTGDVIAFRLRAHHLADRQPADRLLQVAGACAVQNSPPGSALLALQARVQDVAADRFDRLVGEQKRLLQTWCMRGSPFFFPTADAAVFTTGVLPTTQAGRLHLVAGVEPALDRLGMGLDQAVDLAAEAVVEVLSGRLLPIRELGQRLAEQVEVRLSPGRRAAWREVGPYAADQPLGEAVMHFCLRILTLRGLVCLAPRSRSTAPFVLLDEWLGRALPQEDPQESRAGLLRRYLHCYGPSTRRDFAAWLGVRAGDVGPWWDALADELAAVDADGRSSWLLAADLAALQSCEPVRGVRLLPPGDPYTQGRDRATIVAPVHHRELWRAVGSPGAVLADGQIAGTWRARKRAAVLAVTIRAFRPLDDPLRAQVVAEAERVAAVRGVAAADVTFEDAAG